MLTMTTNPPLTSAEAIEERHKNLETTWRIRSQQLTDHEAILKRKADRLDVFEADLTAWEWHLKDTLNKQVDEHFQFLSQQREDHEKFSRLLEAWGKQLTEIEAEMKLSVKEQLEKHFEFLSARRMRAPIEAGGAPRPEGEVSR
jgi:hypothetical protein